MKIKLILPFLFLLVSCSKDLNNIVTRDCSFPVHYPVPGGLVNISIENKEGLDLNSILIEGNKPLICLSGNEISFFYPIKLENTKESLEITSNGSVIKSIFIKDKEYRESRITIENKDLVQAPNKFASRIEKEYYLGLNAKNLRSPLLNQSLKMNFPIKEGIISSEYGVKRFINNKPRNRHKGMDIAAPKGTSILTPLDGKVILSGNFYYRGNIVFLDHGEGVISSYSHMDEVIAKQGEVLKKGEVIGKVGETGRVTGPHLHWETYLLGQAINPSVFSKLIEDL